MVKPGKGQDLHFKQIYHYLHTGSYHPSTGNNEKSGIRKGATKFEIKEDKMLYYIKGEYDRLVLRGEQSRFHAIKTAHEDTKPTCHIGIAATITEVEKKYYWSCITSDVKEYIKNCGGCKEKKAAVFCRKKSTIIQPAQSLQQVVIESNTNSVWQVLYMDIFGPYQVSSGSILYKYCVTFLCTFSKFVVFVPVEDKTLECVLPAIKQVFYTYGFPQHIISDVGPKITQQLDSEISKELGIDGCIISGYHAESNGQGQRTRMALETMLLRYITEIKDDWHNQLSALQFKLNTAFLEEIWCTPHSLLFKHEPHGHLNTDEPETTENPAFPGNSCMMQPTPPTTTDWETIVDKLVTVARKRKADVRAKIEAAMEKQKKKQLKRLQTKSVRVVKIADPNLRPMPKEAYSDTSLAPVDDGKNSRDEGESGFVMDVAVSSPPQKAQNSDAQQSMESSSASQSMENLNESQSMEISSAPQLTEISNGTQQTGTGTVAQTATSKSSSSLKPIVASDTCKSTAHQIKIPAIPVSVHFNTWNQSLLKPSVIANNVNTNTIPSITTNAVNSKTSEPSLRHHTAQDTVTIPPRPMTAAQYQMIHVTQNGRKSVQGVFLQSTPNSESLTILPVSSNAVQ